MPPDTPINPTPTSKGYYTETLLSKAHPPELASQIFTEKIKSRVLNLNPTQPSDVADGRAQRRRERAEKLALRRKSRKPKPLTAKEKRKLRIYEIPPECQKYEIYEPLHTLWVGYVQETLFGDAGMAPRATGGGHIEKGKSLMLGQELAAKIMAADLHGAEMKVVRSRCPSRVGIKGIMVKETKMTFEIVTKENAIKIIPKEHSIFEVEVPPKLPEVLTRTETTGEVKNLVFQIHGTNFMYRAAERGHKKFKSKPTWDI
ncbi:ribonuclease P protein subunit p29 [Terfezia boudieri ATCC MYA-4762]|uniref:Ribonuclease P protein subunit n=1 Tax=Terfezia boudieri ATCC MYA-4762 TaxID=1051890 RepID=A0A3N4LDF6_9PEZI|nr:ribonuclease P protein subunit p29 [Terfezia boudieri ATCC MYA-4762]